MGGGVGVRMGKCLFWGLILRTREGGNWRDMECCHPDFVENDTWNVGDSLAQPNLPLVLSFVILTRAVLTGTRSTPYSFP